MEDERFHVVHRHVREYPIDERLVVIPQHVLDPEPVGHVPFLARPFFAGNFPKLLSIFLVFGGGRLVQLVIKLMVLFNEAGLLIVTLVLAVLPALQ